jgi:hypothetical protein
VNIIVHYAMNTFGIINDLCCHVVSKAASIDVPDMISLFDAVRKSCLNVGEGNVSELLS